MRHYVQQFWKLMTILLVISLVSTACQPIVPVSDQPEGPVTLTGRTFVYDVSGYTIQLTFTSETELEWEYLAAPEGEELSSDTETLDRMDVRNNLVYLSWTEASGTHVMDVLDLDAMKLHVVGVMPDGTRFTTQADVTEVTATETTERTTDEVVPVTLTGRTFVYDVSGYTIQLTFTSETELEWEYLAAPEGEELSSDTETLDRMDVRNNLVYLSWTEASGTHVMDVLDLDAMKLHVVGVMPDGTRFTTQADVTEVIGKDTVDTADAASATAAMETAAATQAPNILFLVLDDAGYSDLGAFGSEIPTPNLDTLSRNGLTFTDFHTAPSCSPTRAELLTGQDHHAAGFGNMGEDITAQQEGQPGYEGYLNERTLPIAKLLRDNGYHTYMAGKWHLGRGEHIPSNNGFEETFTLVQGFSGHFGPQPAMVYGGNPIVQTYLRNGEPTEWPEGAYSTEFYTDQMIEFIESNRESGRPWFSYMAYTTPHDPMQAPDEWVEKMDGMYDEGYAAVREARLARMIELGIIPANTTVAPYPDYTEFAPWDQLSDEEKGVMSKSMEVYAAMLGKLDHDIGRLLTYLEETGELENTWIFVFSDNGPNGEGQNAYFSEEYLTATYDNDEESIGTANSFFLYGSGWGWVSATPLRGYKGEPTEGGIRAPLFISGPGLARAGEMHDHYAEVTDIYPTVLELAGVQFPSTYNGIELLPLPGKSLLPYAMNEAETIHSDDATFGEELWGRAGLRKGEWKILWICPPMGTGGWQLFDLSSDLAELNDLAAEHPEKLAELVADYETYVADLGVIGDLGVLPWDYTAGITEACPTPNE